MKEKRASILIGIRNAVWDFRKRMQGDRFEKKRGSMVDDNCGVVSLVENGMLIGELVDYFSRLEYRGQLPELNCILQYEEEGQICSLHWMEDEKYQIHMRLFWCRTSEFARAQQYVSISCHREIRADHSPWAHIRGKELSPFCTFVTEFRLRKA